MKSLLRKTALGLLALLLSATGLLAITVFVPSLLYAHESRVAGFRVLHEESALPGALEERLAEARHLVMASELYREDFGLELALNDGSAYPALIERIKGPGFAHGFANKVVLCTETDFDSNEASLRGYAWTLNALIAHEMVHCYQYEAYGWASRSMPVWKLEGYAEYIARRQSLPLNELLPLYQKASEAQESWVSLPDGNGCPLSYLEDHLLIAYLMDHKGMSYREIVADESLDKDRLLQELPGTGLL